MAVYKVIQDIESEDKLLGPLTLKGFVYAAIALLSAFIEFKLLFIGTPLKWVFILIFAAPMVLFGVLASPLGREQPTEVWLLSRIRFFLKPRGRIWDLEGMSEYVTVTAPKKVEAPLVKDLSQTEVQSRLKTLATTLDTRGWAIKNVDVNLSTPEVKAAAAPDSDRLIDTAKLPQQAPITDVKAADDIMDEKNNPTAIKFDSMMKHAEAQRKHGLLSALKDWVEPEAKPVKTKKRAKKEKHSRKSTKDLPATKAALQRVKKMSAAERARQQAIWEAQIAEKLVKARTDFGAEFENGHKKDNPAHHVVGPIRPPARRHPAATQQPAANPVTQPPQADNMKLAQSGSAFSVATLSKLANRQPNVQQTGPDEVTISLR